MKVKNWRVNNLKALHPGTWAALLAVLIFMGCSKKGADQDLTEPTAGDAEKIGLGQGPAELVSLTPEQIQSFKIRVETLQASAAAGTVTRPARIMFDLDRLAKVGPIIKAKVVRVLKDLGASVAPGEPLAVMSSVELGRAKADYLTARARLETDRTAYERAKGLYERKISSESDMLEARARFEQAQANLKAAQETLRLYGLTPRELERLDMAEEEPLSYFRLYSPIAGVVQQREVSPGDSLTAEQTPIHVADTKQVWVMIDAFEEDVPLLATGQTVEVRLHSLPRRAFRGATDWVSRSLDETTRTIRVRAVLDNPDGALRSGMFGSARLHTGHPSQFASIPVDALQTVEGKTVVFVPGDAPGTFRPVTVKAGTESDGQVEILAGVSPGDKVVVSGAFALKAALTVKPGSADED